MRTLLTKLEEVIVMVDCHAGSLDCVQSTGFNVGLLAVPDEYFDRRRLRDD